jgi:signal transduction histidine kinase
MSVRRAGIPNAVDKVIQMTPRDCVQELQERERQLAFIRKITGILTSPDLPLEQKLKESLRLILDEIGARTGSIMLLEEGGRLLKIVAATREELIGRSQEMTEDSVSAHVCRSRTPLLIKDIAADPRFRLRSGYSTTSLISAPLLSVEEDRLVGVINASDHQDSNPFTPGNLETVLRYTTWISPLLENSFLLSRLREEKDRFKIIAEELSLKQNEILIASTERSELVEMVVHDFKSPLAAIISNLDLLHYVGLYDEQKPIVDTALGGAKRLLEMINDFLEIARLDHLCNDPKRFHSVAVIPVLTELLKELAPVSKSKRIDMRISSRDDVTVIAEPTLLHHLFQNLLSNALKYTPEEGRIRIGWEMLPPQRRGDKSLQLIRFSVEDNGIGIPNEIKEDIFKKFKRGNRLEDFGLDGSGIGLFICQKIMTILKGRIWVEDAIPRGSRFCFTLFAPDDNNNPNGNE